MKKTLTLLSIITLTFFIASCGVEEPKNEIIEEVKEEVVVDDVNLEETFADTSSTGVYQEEVDENTETSLQDAMKQNTKEEVIEGGMSFCDCVKKQKQLSDLMLSTEDDDVFDQAMTDIESMKTGDCKILFAGNQNTMEEKKAHERKVKKCLSK